MQELEDKAGNWVTSLILETFVRHTDKSVCNLVRNKGASNIITGRGHKRIRDWQKNSGITLLHYSAAISGNL